MGPGDRHTRPARSPATAALRCEAHHLQGERSRVSLQPLDRWRRPQIFFFNRFGIF